MAMGGLVVDMGEIWERFPSFSLIPTSNGARIEGPLACRVRCPDGREFTLDHFVRIEVPGDFPQSIPTAEVEAGQLHEKWDHFLGADRVALCLGSPFRLRMILRKDPTLIGFLDRVILPYFANHEAFTVGQSLPFGELNHGTSGLLSEYQDILKLEKPTDVLPMLELLGRKRRIANKHACPCRSGMRLGVCHARSLSELRRQILPWEFIRIYKHLRAQDDYTKKLVENEKRKQRDRVGLKQMAALL